MSFAVRRRKNLWSALRRAGFLLLFAAFLVAASVTPLLLGWWDTALPAAVGSAIAGLVLLAVLVNAPLEAIAYVALYTDRDPYALPPPPRGFGRALYRESARLDALAREAGLKPLSAFESPDPLETKQAPLWHAPQDALPTVEHLLAHAGPAMRPHLEYLRTVLGTGRGFYFMVKTWAGGTNARVEALRHGDLSVIARR